MGNYRFRLSDMMPNAWFYKLRDMNKSRNHNTPHHHQATKKKLQPSPNQNPRKSQAHKLIFTSLNNPKASDTHFPHDPPRKSFKQNKTKRKTIYKPSPKQVTPSSFPVRLKPDPVQAPDYFESSIQDKDFLDDHHESLSSSESEFSDRFDNHILLVREQSFSERLTNYSCSSTCSCKMMSSSTNHDIIIDMDKISSRHSTKIEKSPNFDMISEPELPPILTKPKKHNFLQENPNFKNSSSIHSQVKNSFQPKKNTKLTSPSSRKSVSRAGKVKIKGNWQKYVGKKSDVVRGRKSLTNDENSKGMFYSQSLAIVKASLDPEQDFRDSMMEMIVENNIRASKDLEDLLACYLSLNSNQYHDLIIKAFEQIWFNMPQPRL